MQEMRPAAGIDGVPMRHHCNNAHTSCSRAIRERTDYMLRFPRYGARGAIFGAGILIGSALPLLVFAHDAASPHLQPAAASSDESAFLKESDAAMNKMMDDMAAKPSGDIDRDFVAMMTAHHQGAID